ncbi:MAG: helix-turn-helix domain-containing protein [Bacteroidota bacterium]
MEYKIYPPKEALAKKIKYFWSLEDFETTSPHSKERVFPDGCIELIFHYGDHFKKIYQNGTNTQQPKSFIHGQITSYIELEATGKIGVFSARFKPNGLQSFIDFDVAQLTDTTMTVAEVWKEKGKELVTTILKATSNEMRVEILERFLETKLKESKKNDETIDFCVDAIVNSNGTIAIEKLTDELDISKRQLERKFQAIVGLNLKMFSRITRFNFALQLIEKKEFDGFTKVAYDGGFYDQAHFIKDFKDLTGLNPKQYFSENLEMVKFFNL